MLNLLVSYGPKSWETNPVVFNRSRVATEYTDDDIVERYRALDDDALSELKSFPSLFVVEGEEIASRLGYVVDIKPTPSDVSVFFAFDPIFPPLAPGVIATLKSDIGLGRWELTRTHWAIKNVDIFNILIQKGLITDYQISHSQYSIQQAEKNQSQRNALHISNNKQVFIVHGHDEIAKLDVASFIQHLGLEPVILHMQASGGRTIIEKIEEYTNVGFGVVLYTGCDIGTKRDSLIFSRRARQNVVFEHGYLIAKLGRSRVAALVKGDVETPNDISGVAYIELDELGHWKQALIAELRNAGYLLLPYA